MVEEYHKGGEVVAPHCLSTRLEQVPEKIHKINLLRKKKKEKYGKFRYRYKKGLDTGKEENLFCDSEDEVKTRDHQDDNDKDLNERSNMESMDETDQWKIIKGKETSTKTFKQQSTTNDLGQMASQNQYDVLSEDDDDNYDPTKTQPEETKLNGKAIDKMEFDKEYFWDDSSSDESSVEEAPKMEDTVCGTKRTPHIR